MVNIVGQRDGYGFPPLAEFCLQLPSSEDQAALYYDWFVFEGSTENIRLQPNVARWCRETLSGSWDIYQEVVTFGLISSTYGGDVPVTGSRVVVRFDNDADMIAFKLRWL